MEDRFNWLSFASKYMIQTSCIDNTFFYNYKDSGLLNLGPVLFFLTLLYDNYEFEHHHEFMSYDGLSTCLVSSNEETKQFDTFKYIEGTIQPNLQAINEIKSIRYSRDLPTSNSVD